MQLDVKVLLPGVGSSSHPLNLGDLYLLQVLDVGPYVESDVMWEDKKRYNIIPSDHSNIMMSTVVKIEPSLS